MACLAIIIVLIGLARVNIKSRNLSLQGEVLEAGFYFIVFLCAKVRNFILQLGFLEWGSVVKNIKK